MTSAVILLTTTVSMKGSSQATILSRIGSSVRAAELAIGAEPTPASLSNAACLTPYTKTAIKPPASAACGEKASLRIVAMAAGISAKLVDRIQSAARK